jgi:hypothetical protein
MNAERSKSGFPGESLGARWWRGPKGSSSRCPTPRHVALQRDAIFRRSSGVEVDTHERRAFEEWVPRREPGNQVVAGQRQGTRTRRCFIRRTWLPDRMACDGYRVPQRPRRDSQPPAAGTGARSSGARGCDLRNPSGRGYGSGRPGRHSG